MPNSASEIGNRRSVEMAPDGDAYIANTEQTANSAVELTLSSGQFAIITDILTYGDGVNDGYAWFTIGGYSSGRFLSMAYSIGLGGLVESAQTQCRIPFYDTASLFIRNESESTQCIGCSGVEWLPEIMGRELVGVTVQITGDTTLEVTPPSGEEWLITCVTTSGDGTNEGWAGTGVSSSYIRPFLKPSVGFGQGDANRCAAVDARVFVDNSNKLYVRNDYSGTRACFYGGILWRT